MTGHSIDLELVELLFPSESGGGRWLYFVGTETIMMTAKTTFALHGQQMKVTTGLFVLKLCVCQDMLNTR